MARYQDPQQLPDDAGSGELAAYVGEDIGRQLVGRGTLFVALLCALAGFTTDSDQAVRTAGIVVGLGGALAILVAALAKLRRWRQWAVILTVLVGSGALLAVMLVQHRASM